MTAPLAATRSASLAGGLHLFEPGLLLRRQNIGQRLLVLELQSLHLFFGGPLSALLELFFVRPHALAQLLDLLLLFCREFEFGPETALVAFAIAGFSRGRGCSRHTYQEGHDQCSYRFHRFFPH